MVAWRPFSGWMDFPRLDVSWRVERSFTIAYRITDNGGELWTRRLNGFKEKYGSAFYGAAILMQEAIQALVEGLALNKAETVFVPALSSGETAASKSRAIPIIACICAAKVGARFELDALKKLVHRPLHSCRDESERDAELDAAAYESAPLNARSVLVFDDLITRGATLSRIAEAITASTPGAKVYGVALGKTEKRAYIPAIYDDYVPNDHVPQEWNSLWEQGEERYRERNKG